MHPSPIRLIAQSRHLLSGVVFPSGNRNTPIVRRFQNLQVVPFLISKIATSLVDECICRSVFYSVTFYSINSSDSSMYSMTIGISKINYRKWNLKNILFLKEDGYSRDINIFSFDFLKYILVFYINKLKVLIVYFCIKKIITMRRSSFIFFVKRSRVSCKNFEIANFVQKF